MNSELPAQCLGESREAFEVLLQPRRLAHLLADKDLAVDQVGARLIARRQCRFTVQVDLDKGTLAPLPARQLVIPQRRQQFAFLTVEQLTHGRYPPARGGPGRGPGPAAVSCAWPRGGLPVCRRCPP